MGLPADPAAWAALGAAIVACLLLPVALRSRRGRTLRPAVLAVLASALSAAYVSAYLRGGPRIVDATTYLLEARAIAAGELAWPAPEPASSVVGRFLVRDVLAGGEHLAGIFPPGWPLLLAVGVRLGAPMAVGPALAALLVLATWWLAREVRERLTGPGDDAAWAALLPETAAATSAVCACLRYHTADTMSHGLAALLATTALAAGLSASRRASGGAGLALLAGLALGWLAATRPPTALAAGLVLAAILGSRRASSLRVRARRLALAAVAATPGLALLALHQRAATGAWLASSQSLYYGLADGPAGCFRWGFGDGVGCEHEHGAFVAANLPDGFGAFAATKTTLRRLKAHLVDPLGAELLFPLVVAGGVRVLRAAGSRAIALWPLALLAAYAPFYFDGNYPGGGARFLADALPVEHVLAAVAALSLARRLGRAPELCASLLVAASLAGFAFRASHDHALLRDREGGRPMFEPALAERLGARGALIFVDTDHGFAIGHDPGARARGGADVRRLRGDLVDRLTWEAAGRPRTFRWSLSTLEDGRLAEAGLVPFEPPPSDRVEGESLWPSLGQSGGFARPGWAQGTCASAGRWLAIATSGGAATIDLELPRGLRGRRLVPIVARAEGVGVRVSLLGPAGEEATVEVGRGAAPWACEEVPGMSALPEGGRLRLRLHVLPAGAAAPREAQLAFDALRVVED